MTQKNVIVSRTNQIKIIWYNWDVKMRESSSMFDIIPKPLSDNLNKSTSYDISNHIIDFSFSKTMSDGAGSFSLTLGNSLDWAKYLKAGTWFLVFASPNGDLTLPEEISKAETSMDKGKKLISKSTPLADVTFNTMKRDEEGKLTLPEAPKNIELFRKYIRGICFVQRVGISSSVGPDGELEITYKVSGKDFGVTLEENELWFNTVSNTEQGMWNSLSGSELALPAGKRRLNVLLDIWVDAFLKPDKFIGSLKGRKQWVLPDKLLLDLGIKTAQYTSDIPGLKQLSNTTFENNLENPLNGLQGNAWERLKQLSQPEFHELFTELGDNGLPRIYFRPIPWGVDQSKYPSLAQTIDTYLSLAKNESSALNLSEAVHTGGKIKGFFEGGIRGLVAGAIDAFTNPPEARTTRLDLKSEHIINTDVGPDFHSHYNHFIVEPSSNQQDLKVALSILGKFSGTNRPFPFENTESIKRYGFRPRHLSVAAFKLEVSGFGLKRAGESIGPEADFLRQINEVQIDYWSRQKHLYSGTFTIAGREDIRLGKVFVTDSDIPALGGMVFYIEGYTDTISIDANGTVDWIQTVTVTRGTELADLESGSNFGEKEGLTTLGSFIKK